MANTIFKRATLNVYFLTGVTADGKAIRKRQTLQHVAENTSAASLNAVADAIAMLYNGQLDEVETVNNSMLV